MTFDLSAYANAPAALGARQDDGGELVNLEAERQRHRARLRLYW